MTIEQIKHSIAPVLEHYDVQYAGVFGSFARGEDTPQSDVDILVSLKHPVGLLKFFALNDELENVLKRKVDLVTKNSLNTHVKPFALKDIQTVYEVG
jgi:uncharacterized protein